MIFPQHFWQDQKYEPAHRAFHKLSGVLFLFCQLVVSQNTVSGKKSSAGILIRSAANVFGSRKTNTHLPVNFLWGEELLRCLGVTSPLQYEMEGGFPNSYVVHSSLPPHLAFIWLLKWHCRGEWCWVSFECGSSLPPPPSIKINHIFQEKSKQWTHCTN